MDVSRLNFEGPVEEQIENLLGHVRLSRDDVTDLSALLNDLEQVLRNVWPSKYIYRYIYILLSNDKVVIECLDWTSKFIYMATKSESHVPMSFNIDGWGP